MSVKNFVQCGLVTPVATNTTELVLNVPVAPYDYPPLDGGTLVIADSVARPSYYEIITYTHRIDNVIYGVVRAKEGTSARAWTGSTWVYQALTAADYIAALLLKANLDSPPLTGLPTAPTAAPGTNTNQIATMAAVQAAISALIESSPAALNTLNELAAALGDDPNFASTMTTALSGKEPSIAAGTSSQMWLGNKTWASVLSQVQGTLLTGLGAGSNATIVSTDSLIGALAKIQNQLNNKCASTDARLSDAREWTATEVAQSEAEAGSVATVRKWSALRVAQAIRGNILTGLNLTLGTAVASTDTLLVGIGKLQKQITDLATNLAGSVRATALSGYLVGSNVVLADDDTVLEAFGKVQGQISARALSNNPTFTGSVNGPTPADGDSSTLYATTAFVQGAIGGYLAKAVTGGTVTLTAAEANNPVIALTGTLTSNLILQIPAASMRIYSISNGTTGAFTVSIKVVGLTPVVLVAQGKRNLIYTNGVGAYDAINDFDAIALTGVSTCTTAAVGTNTTQIASTAYTVAEIGSRALAKTGGTVTGPIILSGPQATYNYSATHDSNGNFNISRYTKAGAWHASLMTMDYNGAASFSAGVSAPSFSGPLVGNASTATKLVTPRNINGVPFDGSQNITIAAGETGRLPLTGGTLTGALAGTTCNFSGRATLGDAWTSGWYRSSGVVGWYNETYGGGIAMEDTTFVRTWGGKAFKCSNNLQIEGTVLYITFTDTDWGTRYVHSNGGSIGFLNSGGAWSLQNDNAGNTTATGNLTAYSDIRLKKDIELIPDALAKINTLRGVTYERIDNGERQTGVIAQEIQAVLPEAVLTGLDENKTLSVAYGNLVGLLIEGIKELTREVEMLKEAQNGTSK